MRNYQENPIFSHTLGYLTPPWDCPKTRAQPARCPLCTDVSYGAPARESGVYGPLPHIRRPCEILMKSGRPVVGERLRSVQSFGGCWATNASGIRGESATYPQPDGPISFRFNRVTALSEEEAHRHCSPWRAPHRIRPYRADTWRAAPWFSDSLKGGNIA